MYSRALEEGAPRSSCHDSSTNQQRPGKDTPTVTLCSHREAVSWCWCWDSNPDCADFKLLPESQSRPNDAKRPRTLAACGLGLNRDGLEDGERAVVAQVARLRPSGSPDVRKHLRRSHQHTRRPVLLLDSAHGDLTCCRELELPSPRMARAPRQPVPAERDPRERAHPRDAAHPWGARDPADLHRDRPAGARALRRLRAGPPGPS
jgi:hypothetical protein